MCKSMFVVAHGFREENEKISYKLKTEIGAWPMKIGEIDKLIIKENHKLSLCNMCRKFRIS